MPKIKNHNKLFEAYNDIRESLTHAKPGSPLLEAKPATLLANERVVSSLAYLLDEFGDEMTAAIKLVAIGEGTLNGERNLNVSSYHRARVNLLSEQIESIDLFISHLRDDPFLEAADIEAQVAALNGERRYKSLVLKDHESKLENRNHGIHMTGMRRRH